MAETRLTDVIVPSVFSEYTVEPSIYQSRLWKSGVIQLDASISAKLGGGGTIFNLPNWDDVSGDGSGIPSETAATTVGSVGTSQQAYRRHFREKAWGQNAISVTSAGSSAVEAAAERVNNFWAREYDLMVFASLQGVIADDVADSSDITNDISGGVGAAAIISDDDIIDTQALLGENGVGLNDGLGDFSTLVVHSATKAYLKKQDLIDTVAISGQTRPLAFYDTMQVIVDDNAPVPSAGVYQTYMLKTGAIKYGVTSVGYEPTEIERIAGQGFGIDNLWTRRVAAIHPVGYTWSDGSVAGVSPTNAELKLAANWARAYKAGAQGIVCLIHKLA